MELNPSREHENRIRLSLNSADVRLVHGADAQRRQQTAGVVGLPAQVDSSHFAIYGSCGEAGRTFFS
jgi:hypothetical protein